MRHLHRPQSLDVVAFSWFTSPCIGDHLQCLDKSFDTGGLHERITCNEVTVDQLLYTSERVTCDSGSALSQNGKQRSPDIAYGADVFQTEIEVLLSLAVPNILFIVFIVCVILANVLRLCRPAGKSSEEGSGGGIAVIHHATAKRHSLGNVTPDVDFCRLPYNGMTVGSSFVVPLDLSFDIGSKIELEHWCDRARTGRRQC